MSRKTDGASLLATKMAGPPRISQTVVAKLIRVQQQSVSDWLAGKSRPNAISRALLGKHFEIAEDAWLTAEERRALAAPLKRTGT